MCFCYSLKPVVFFEYYFVISGLAPYKINSIAISLWPLKMAESKGLVQKPNTYEPIFGSAPCNNSVSTML